MSDSPTGPFVDSGAPIITDADRPKEARGGQAIDVDVFQDPKTGKDTEGWQPAVMGFPRGCLCVLPQGHVLLHVEC